jgi:hypothetical protein
MSPEYIDSRQITVADSWVVPSNKTGTGNGEAKIYVGQRASEEYTEFFGESGFHLNCRLRKTDLLRFLDELKSEYWFPTFPYRAGIELRELWNVRRSEIEAFSGEFLHFECSEQTQIEGPRGYINSDNPIYQIIRSLPLPETSSLTLIKLREDDQTIFEFRLSPDFEATTHRRFEDELAEELLALESPSETSPLGQIKTTAERLIQARIGQQRFKRDLLNEREAICPFTKVSDPGLLTASHIKPWAKSDDVEKLDPQNGLLFTPTYDRLFDQGLITFANDRTLRISPRGSNRTAELLKISNGAAIEVPLLGDANKKRRDYMEFHRDVQFRA